MDTVSNVCEHCGKTDFDLHHGCVRPVVYSAGVGDWFCHEPSEARQAEDPCPADPVPESP